MSSAFVTKKIFLTQGVGKHREKLSSFEMALRSAGIAQYNLVRVSSIFPPHAKLISKKDGIKLLKPGQILYVVMSENATNEPHRLVAVLGRRRGPEGSGPVRIPFRASQLRPDRQDGG